MIIKASSDKDFFYKYMRLHSIGDSFSERELQVAVEFLSYRQKYLKEPIQKTLK